MRIQYSHIKRDHLYTHITIENKNIHLQILLFHTLYLYCILKGENVWLFFFSICKTLRKICVNSFNISSYQQDCLSLSFLSLFVCMSNSTRNLTLFNECLSHYRMSYGKFLCKIQLTLTLLFCVNLVNLHFSSLIKKT